MVKYTRLLMMLTVLFGLAMSSATTVRADDPPGAKLFSTYCAACHGAAGQKGFAPAIGSPTYLAANNDAAIAQITSDGTKSGMPAWSKSKGGTLTDDQIKDIVAYLRSLAGGASTTTAPSSATASAPVYVQTKLGVKSSTDPQGNLVLSATLTEFDGFPVIGASVQFARTTRFGNVSLGSAKTDTLGNASLSVGDIPEESQIVAAFAGEKNWNPSEAKLTLSPVYVASSSSPVNRQRINLSVDEPLLPPEGSLITPNPPLVPATLFLLVVGGIWTVYAFVISQILGIKKAAVDLPMNRLSFRAKR